MNRFKKELRAHGLKLEMDYDFLPCDHIEMIVVDAEHATVTTYNNISDPFSITLSRDTWQHF